MRAADPAATPMTNRAQRAKNKQTHSAFRRSGMLLALVVPLLTACGGGGGGGTPVPATVPDQATINNVVLDATTSTSTSTVTYTVGGTVNSVIPGSTLVLQNNGGDNLTVSADGSFSFPTRVANGATYNVTVLTNPTNQVCAVTNASGKVSDANVTNVTVSCHAGFSDTGDLLTARYWHTTTLLPNGKVLVTGGYDVNTQATAKAELYDPATGTWTATGSMAKARETHTATLLPDGRVLVVGGYDGGFVGGAELYDPDTGTWSTAASPTVARANHSATLLKDGTVLVAGGNMYDYPYYIAVNAELYDPQAGTWASAGTMVNKRITHEAVLLENGKVLVAGGWDSENRLASAELYDPSAKTWAPAESMGFARNGHTMTKLPSGTVLVTGGYGNVVYDGSYSHAGAEVYDPVAGTWTATGSMVSKRGSHTATLLGNGKVLVAGGSDANIHASAELYDPGSGTWSATGGMKTARTRASAILLLTSALPEDRVLMVGGLSQTALSSAELYW